MPKIYSAREIVSILSSAGLMKVSQQGSHIKLKGIRKGKTVTVIVPNHKSVARGTFSSILRQAHMTPLEFETYRN